MSSSFGFLAYSFRERESYSVTQMRAAHSREFFAQVHTAPLVETRVGDGLSGMIGWHAADRSIDWDVHEVRAGAMTTWLHVPSAAGGPESGVDSWLLATDVLAGNTSVSELGAPFAVARWDSGTLEIVNDVFGLVRLFHYRFPDVDIWTTRQSLAHIFAGVQPYRNDLAWAGIATIGWAPGGATHIGEGEQLPGGSRICVTQHGDTTQVKVTENLSTWLKYARGHAEPSASEIVADMATHMSTARRWQRGVIADLSGGKDSRVTAAIGICNGSIAGLRTVNTDPGEVRTAQQLVSMLETDIPHTVTERRPPAEVDGTSTFADRLLASHRAFEGRYLPQTAFNSQAFKGFASSVRPKFNGLGGEVFAGGNFQTNSWARISDEPIGESQRRLSGMLRSGIASSDNAIALGMDFAQSFVRRAGDIGATTAGEVLDLFYALDRMPNWAVTFASDSTICPLFSPGAMISAVHSMGASRKKGAAHRELIREVIPSWAEIPFFSPEFKTRLIPPVWELREWPGVSKFIKDRVGSLAMYSQDRVYELLDADSRGQGTRSQEIALHGILWDLTFEDYLQEVSEAVDDLRGALPA